MESTTQPTTTQATERSETRQGVVNRLNSLIASNPEFARSEALDYVSSVERKGGYFLVTEREQDTFSICRHFLITGEVV